MLRPLFDSFWRAAAYCLHPRVILLSLLPLVLLVGLSFGLGYFFWETAIDGVRDLLNSLDLLHALFSWLESIGAGNLKSVLGPLVVIFLATPVLVLLSLLVVATLMTPAMLNLVAQRRFPLLERRHGGTFVGSVVVSLGSTAVAIVALIASIPLWFVPLMVLVVPPLIWGWLTYRVMVYDTLSEHASKDERRELIRRHRASFLGLGIATGYLGAAPSLVWASGLMFIALAPILVPVAIWIYTLVFAFSSLWFAHFALAALAGLRAEQQLAAAVVLPPPADPIPLPRPSASEDIA
jgi:hypothetical protein